jgi:hypothetical protein
VVNVNLGKDVTTGVPVADLPVSLTPAQWCTLTCEYLREFSKKVRNDAIGIGNMRGLEEDDS